MNSNERFKAILQQIQETHDKKQDDYGTDDDPFANINAARELGIEPVVACILRMNDKMMRLKAFVRSGKLTNESLEDTLLDMAVYSAIGLTLAVGDRVTWGEKYGMVPDSSPDKQGVNYQDRPPTCVGCGHATASHGSTDRIGLSMCFLCPTIVPFENRCLL